MDKAPLATKAATSAAIFGASDACAQKLERVKEPDATRLLTTTAIGGLYFAPAARTRRGIVRVDRRGRASMASRWSLLCDGGSRHRGSSVTPSTRPLEGVDMAWMQKKLTRKNNTGARLVRADHETHPEERPQGDPDQGFIRSNFLRPPGHHRLLRGRVRAGRGPVHFTGEDQGRLTTGPDRRRGLLALRRSDQLRLHPDRVHSLICQLRVVRLDDLPFIEVACREEVSLFKSRRWRAGCL